MLPFYHKTLPYHLIFKIIYLTFLINEGTKRTLEEAQEILFTIQTKAAVNKYSTAVAPKLFENELISSLTKNALSINNFPSEFNIEPAKYNLIDTYHNITNN